MHFASLWGSKIKVSLPSSRQRSTVHRTVEFRFSSLALNSKNGNGRKPFPFFGPSGETRTRGILLPKQARYQLRYTWMYLFKLLKSRRASCCGARYLPRLSKAFGSYRPLPLARLPRLRHWRRSPSGYNILYLVRMYFKGFDAISQGEKGKGWAIYRKHQEKFYPHT